MNRNVVVGIMMVLVVFIVPTVAADNSLYFVPQDSSGDTGEEVTVLLYCNATDAIGGGQVSIYFDHGVVNITSGKEMTGTTDWISWNFYPYGYAGHSYAQITYSQWGGSFTGNMIGIANLTLVGATLDVSPLEMPVASDKTMLFTSAGPEVSTTAINGTFTCEATAPNVVVTANNVSFGTMLAGNRQELNVSLTLKNIGAAQADIKAVFKTNVSGFYGLKGTCENIIPGNNFALGPAGDEKALTNTTDTTPIYTIGVDETVTFDAILIVPAGQAAADYSGIVELSW